MNLDSVINDIKKQIATLTEGLRVLEREARGATTENFRAGR
jgi:hypothetical protein